ncbi:hypothetical protein [Clostridium sp.]|uniref:hypothetical protein n=1 Tax=Clostridium sp. TaxID=1506 RepID=UPI0028FF49B9|nr:hypothetical protein [Clostridium sp.]MDU1031897.1 hypothetical protein [Clostridium sp.]
MGFRLEKDMTNLITKDLESFVNVISNEKREFIYSCEYPVYYRIIDMCMASYCEDYNSFSECRDYEKAINRLSSRCFGILALISTYKKVSINRICNELFLAKEEAINSLNVLCKYGLIKKVSNYSYTIGEWSVLIPSDLYAIEMKLSKWQEALEQGIFNLKFADYSYVIMDKERINSENIVEEYRKNNVGLIYLGEDSSLKVIYKPKKNRKINMYSSNYYKIKILKDFIINQDKWKKTS